MYFTIHDFSILLINEFIFILFLNYYIKKIPQRRPGYGTARTAQNPLLLFRLVFVFAALLRSETRMFVASLFQLPPRKPDPCYVQNTLVLGEDNQSATSDKGYPKPLHRMVFPILVFAPCPKTRSRTFCRGNDPATAPASVKTAVQKYRI